MTKDPVKAPNRPEYVTLDFLKGIPVRLNGQAGRPLALVEKLNTIAGAHGVGRVDMIENRLVGIKSREVYENPAAAVLHTAIADLEALVLDRETMQYKARISNKYAEMIYNGLWWTPLKQQMDVMFDKVHERTTGTVRLKLYKGGCMAVGRQSPFSRYKMKMATYGEGDQFNQAMAEGFNAFWAMPFQE
jgi:argininosuccinate synthase